MSSVFNNASTNEPARKDPADLPDDPRLMQGVEDYLKELEAGHAPNRQEILRRYPDLIIPLTQCLDGLDLVHKAALPKKPGVPASAASGPIDALTANPLGDYQILREIGRGGMGIVYEALQLSLGRRVALKVLPFAATFDARHLQRFHNEARAAAQLHHTNIVPVYAVGCERGVHFYAMQLIEGQSLATVIHQIKGGTRRADGASMAEAREEGTVTGSFLPHMDAEPLPASVAPETVSQLSLALTTQRSIHDDKFFATVARFMIQAGEALEHAHQFGIVHRDIKPANLLVDVHNQLWITDFGLAQFHADAGLTQTGDILGTLRYMSPEQASGQRVLLDHRTDVYSLGATMYELVTLEPIFPGRNRQELLHQIINDEVRLPRTLDKNIPVELETIILKAVSKSPADRYATAQEFAADLERYLEDKPILAKRPGLIERARKWSRRHPSVVVAGLLVMVFSLVGLVASNWMIAQEQAKTRAALKNEKTSATEARHAVDLLVDITEQELANQPFLQAVRRRLLQAALDYYQDFIETHENDAAALVELRAGKERAARLLAELSTLESLNLMFLANEPDVQANLKVDEATREKLAELNKRFYAQRGPKFDKGFPGKQEDRDPKKLYEYAKEQEAALKEVLEPAQLKRLRQIDLQTQFAKAFHDSYAIDVLKLTSEQRSKIRDIKDQTKEPLRAAKGGLAADRVLKAEANRIVRDVLTPDQQAKWEDLTGAPFEGAIHRPPPRGGPGGPKQPPGPR